MATPNKKPALHVIAPEDGLDSILEALGRVQNALKKDHLLIQLRKLSEKRFIEDIVITKPLVGSGAFYLHDFLERHKQEITILIPHTFEFVIYVEGTDKKVEEAYKAIKDRLEEFRGARVEEVKIQVE
ncbi:TPA: hypothetical protein H1005_02910 [archaeon]|uniref:Uncharacterized protein n=1 Tax=Candidatus Naiadarchaeum limnaeum TaxID=2756139 RepID=A0A832V4F8_9ARCH|nr:hypothetical protein [Candidatus Naiadarchaeales archaeon SRR2090153.bin1042]HIK00747.1 hypothetical protein [Candidatus Naiadarchaeum limnaeum]